jgi:hypothetical protein
MLVFYACNNECRLLERRARPPTVYQLWTNIFATSLPPIMTAFARASGVPIDAGTDFFQIATKISEKSGEILETMEKWSPAWRFSSVMADTAGLFTKWIGPDGDFLATAPSTSGNPEFPAMSFDEFKLLPLDKRIEHCLLSESSRSGPALSSDEFENFSTLSIDKKIDICLRF